MTAPLIVAATTGLRTGHSEQQLELYDPVRAGFADFAEQPAPQRQAVVNESYYAPELSHETTESYLGALTQAVVDTATSTGLQDTPVSLLLRATRKHYQHEMSTRLEDEVTLLDQGLVKLAGTLDRKQRRQLMAALHDQRFTYAPTGYNLLPLSKYYNAHEMQAVIDRGTKATTKSDLPSTQAFLEGLDLKAGQKVDAFTVVSHGLRVLPDRLRQERARMHDTRLTLATVYPEFTDIIAAQSTVS